MKFKTFQALVAVAAVVAAGGALVAAYSACETEGGTVADVAGKKAPAVVAPVAQQTGATPAVGAAGEPGALRPMDTRIIDRVHAGFSGDKVKDAFKGEAYKVNLYKEEGKYRAKVDFDRDEKWDEKWDFETEGGQEVVKRQVSTADNDTYDLEFRLREGKWVAK